MSFLTAAGLKNMGMLYVDGSRAMYGANLDSSPIITSAQSCRAISMERIWLTAGKPRDTSCTSGQACAVDSEMYRLRGMCMTIS
jgi:hypothetical protein